MAAKEKSRDSASKPSSKAKKPVKKKATADAKKRTKTKSVDKKNTGKKTSDNSKTKKSHEFKAETKQLLDLVIHSLYSNKDIFLRELISNSSDALDKLRFEALKDNKLYEKDTELSIKVSVDDKNNTLTVSDNGIGMSDTEIMDAIGTIAKSGTREYLAKLDKKQLSDTNLIGQFGVGFYAAFMVADKVTVLSRKAGLTASKGVKWESEGIGNFTTETINKESRGTDVILHLNEDSKEYLNNGKLKSIITKYSDYIPWPIIMDKENVEDKDKKEDRTSEKVNKAKSIWNLESSKLKDENYQEFYKTLTNDYDNPLLWSHNKVEGKYQYTMLLYIPKHAPYNMNQEGANKGLKLFVQKVFIMDNAEAFIPNYLRFVRGVIDSSDLPLNVSREILQGNKLVSTIKTAVTKKILSLLEKTTKDEKQYETFWGAFGNVLKEGIMEDPDNKEKIAGLLRFTSTIDINQQGAVSLDEYISQMKEGQKNIYYLTVDSLNKAEDNPHLEYPKKQGIEVLILHDKIDQWVTSSLHEYKGKTLKSIDKGIDDIIEENKEELEDLKNEKSELTKKIKEALKEQVKDVCLTNQLTDSPARLIGTAQSMGFDMQQIMPGGMPNMYSNQATLEVNHEHPVIQKLETIEDTKAFESWSQVIYNQALLAQGGQLNKPSAFVKSLSEALLSA